MVDYLGLLILGVIAGLVTAFSAYIINWLYSHKEEDRRMEIFMLLDRTGSMAVRWDETVSGINAYVTEVAKEHPDGKITLAAFDWHAGLQFDVLRDGVKLGDWKEFGTKEVTPRGDTPLFDAISRVAAMAEGNGADRTVLVVMTDGHENASAEVTADGARAAIKRITDRGWQAVFLGAQFDAFDDAKQIGVSRGSTMSYATGHAKEVMHSTATATADYLRSGSPMSFTAADRKAAGEEEVVKKTPTFEEYQKRVKKTKK